MPKTTLKKTDSTYADFQKLVALLERVSYNNERWKWCFLSQFNTIDALHHVLIAYHDGVAVGCGAFKPYWKNTVEIKRMFVLPEFREQGIARKLLKNFNIGPGV